MSNYKNLINKYTRKSQYITIIKKLINNNTIEQNDIEYINTILHNTILKNYNFQYDNPIHRGIVLSIISNNPNNLYKILEKTKIYIHDFYNN
jgi:hypothetical protein